MALPRPCAPPAAGAAAPSSALSSPSAQAGKGCGILSVNDTYRIEASPDGSGGMPAVRALRKRFEVEYPDLLVLHAGDFLFPSFLSRSYKGEQMIDVLNQLDGGPGFDPRLIVTFGNHEFDDDRSSVLNARLNQSAFRWVASNIDFSRSGDGVPYVATHKVAKDLILPCGGFQVGIFGITTDVKKSPMVAEYRDPVESARAKTKELRERGATLVVGLTHVDIETDERILATLGAEGPDLIVGGHEHAKQTRSANGRSVFKADADARTANLIEVTKGEKGPSVAHRWIDVREPEVTEDPALKGVVDGWLSRQAKEYCSQKMKAPPDCLQEVLTTAKSKVVAEELEIRRFETNLGDFIAEQMLAAFAKEGAQIAFVNSGTLRLNRDIAAGTAITREVVEELFAYAAPLRLIEITGEQLFGVLARATSGWTGQGHWLQIAGFAYKFDPKAGKVSNVTLLGDKPRAIAATDKIKAVVNSFLLDPSKGQDGYTMLSPSNVIDKLGPDLSAGPDLKQIVVDALKRTEATGLDLKVAGLICNTERPGLCLAQ
ncbi:MAG: bifunctional metallophosphatase/5'-nucleotidase [Polyangiaceae bacterium]